MSNDLHRTEDVRAARQALIALAPQRLDGTWLVADTGEHDCAGGDDTYHEPGCGVVPLVNLRSLPGWDAIAGSREATINSELMVEIEAIRERSTGTDALRLLSILDDLTKTER